MLPARMEARGRGRESGDEQLTDFAVDARVPGTQYVVRDVLGRGGQSTVYAVENEIGKRLVLKAVRPHLIAREFSERLEDEAKVLVQLEHPNIVAAYDLGLTAEVPPRVFIVMERLTGKTLREILLRAKRLDLLSALECGIAIADALAHAHARGVVHLDVKPDNIFVHVRADGTHVIKLLDFGFMQVLGPQGTAESLSGTPGYGAPEQTLGESVSPLTDVYALGLVLYEILAGRRPFHTDHDMMKAVVARLSHPAPPLSKWVLVPPRVEEIVMGCVERRPSARPASAAAVARDLREARRRVLRAQRGAPTFKTAESLFALAGDTGTIPRAPARLLARSSSHATRGASGAFASSETLDAWFRAPPAGDGDEVRPEPSSGVPKTRARQDRVIAGFGVGGAAILALAIPLAWHRTPPIPPETSGGALNSKAAPVQSPAPESSTTAPVASEERPAEAPMASAAPRPAATSSTKAPAHNGAGRTHARRTERPASSADPILEWLERPTLPEQVTP